MRISRKKRIVWHKRILVYREEFKFSEIIKFKYKIEQESERNRGRYIVGKLYVLTIDKQEKKIFSIDKDVKGQQELVEFEILKDLEHLITLINREMKENYT